LLVVVVVELELVKSILAIAITKFKDITFNKSKRKRLFANSYNKFNNLILFLNLFLNDTFYKEKSFLKN
jgi:hypothetical protein